MEAKIEWDIGTTLMKVWLFERDAIKGGIRLYRCVGNDAWQTEEVPLGGEVVEPSLRLEHRMVKALVEAASDSLPPSGQMAEHLKDTVQVRDRLLALIEKSHSS